MNWLAILVALASIGGTPAPGKAQAKHHCAHHAKHCKTVKPKKSKPKTPTTKVTPRATPAPGATPAPQSGSPSKPNPVSTPTPTPTPVGTVAPVTTPGPTPTPTATPVYPKRTAVDLVEFEVRSSYQTLAAGRVTFNVNNLGMDDHNLSLRGGGKEYGGTDLHSGDTDSLTFTLAAGTYTLYCNIPTHEQLGMSTQITVR